MKAMARRTSQDNTQQQNEQCVRTDKPYEAVSYCTEIFLLWVYINKYILVID